MKVSDLRDLHPEETTPMLGDQTGTQHDRGSAGRNAEQRPSAGTKVEPDDPAENAEEPGSDQAPVPAVMDRDAHEDLASLDYASWLGESGQYELGQYDVQ